MAKESAGKIKVDLELNSKNYDRQLNSKLKGAENAFSSGFKKIGMIIASAFAVKKVVDFSKTCIDSASKVQSAFTGLNSIVQGTGNSFSQAQKFVQEYTKDGLVSIEETATAYKNLLARGYDTSQIEDVLSRLKDSAAFGRQASYDLGEAVVSATEGLKNENSILVDNAGVTKNVAKMWEEYARAHGTSTTAMTQAQKIEAEYNGIMQETRFQIGDAAAYTKTFSGQVQQLKFNFNQMTVAIGKVVAPIAQLFIPIINGAINAVTRLFERLQQVLKIFGLEMPDVVSKSSAGIASVGEAATQSASDAVKSAKKIKKAFSPLDEINVLNNNDSSSGENSGEDTAFESSNVDGINKTEKSVSSLSKKFQELQTLFKKGFDLTFNADFDAIQNSIKNIGNQLKSIFTDKDVVDAGNNFAKTFIFNLGKISGAVVSIGSNIAEFYVGSVEKYFSQNKGRVKKFIIDMFNISSRDINLSGSLWEALSQLSIVFKEDVAKQFGADIISMFANPFMSLTSTFYKFVVDMKSILITPIVDNVDKLKEAINNTLVPIQKITDTMSKAFSYIGDLISKVYDEYMHPFFESLKTGMSDTFGKFLDIYNEYIAPFFDYIAEKVSTMWDKHLKPLWDNISGFIGSIVDALKVVYEKSLKPLIDWIIANIIPILMPILKQVVNGVTTVINTIIDLVSGIIGVLKGVIDFLVGIFTGDWSRAWDGIKVIFESTTNMIKNIFGNFIGFIKDGVISGFEWIKNGISSTMNTIKSIISNIWNGIWNTIKSVINSIIGGIEKMCNTVIQGLNKLIGPLTKVGNSILKAVGIKNFSFSTLKNVTLPRLAEGGWIPRNEPQLTIVGDNTREGEIVAPESKIYDQVMKANRDSGMNNNIKDLNWHIYVHYEDGRTVIKKINQAQIEAGEILLEF